jgi:hypothetical protein
MLTSDLAFLLPITTLLIIGVIVLAVLKITEKRPRNKQLPLPLDKTNHAR